MSGTMVRLVAGLSGLAVLLPALIWGGPIAVEIVVLIAIAICVREYAGMAFPDDTNVASAWLGGGLYPLYFTVVHLPHWMPQIAGLLTVATFIFVTLRPGPDLSRAADRLGRYFVGFCWIGLLFLLARLRMLENGTAWCFVVLGISWLGDTGAYFSGRQFGRTKLYERISPNKSLEGAIGGVITATIGVFILTAIGMPGVVHPVHCVLLGVFGCTIGVLGDLGESLLKRAFGVKDAGNIMPGHGGLLDRIDSVLFVGAAVYAYATLVMGTT